MPQNRSCRAQGVPKYLGPSPASSTARRCDRSPAGCSSWSKGSAFPDVSLLEKMGFRTHFQLQWWELNLEDLVQDKRCYICLMKDTAGFLHWTHIAQRAIWISCVLAFSKTRHLSASLSCYISVGTVCPPGASWKPAGELVLSSHSTERWSGAGNWLVSSCCCGLMLRFGFSGWGQRFSSSQPLQEGKRFAPARTGGEDANILWWCQHLSLTLQEPLLTSLDQTARSEVEVG